MIKRFITALAASFVLITAAFAADVDGDELKGTGNWDMYALDVIGIRK
ncbi:MAG: hypothetical protein P8J14_08820 [Emcibacteraceae bacterium]|nr:hypothetical protein [Emcibacteraceae bacterium]